MSESKGKWRFGFKRWIVLGLIILGAIAAFGPYTALKPISPVVVLPGEATGISILGFEITNTILATILADVLLLLIAFGARRFVKSGQLVPQGFYNAFEAIVEFLWNTVEGAAGNKWAKRIFPVVATIFLLIFVANMVKMVPGFESIGRLAPVHKVGATGYASLRIFSLGSLNVYSIDKGQPHVVAAHTEDGDLTEEETSSGDICTACEIIPFLRGSATDLNFTFALAIIAVVMTQVYGVWAQGPAYFEKFFQIKQVISGGIFGLINFFVGLLEIVLELAKVLSFGFRLFGNIFAGALLLSIVGALTAVAVPAGLYLFEVFFGIIQAYVFFLLATMFISGALASHHGGDNAESGH